MENLNSFAEELWKFLQNHTYFFLFFYQIVRFTKLGGRKEFQTSSRKSAAAGQSTRRLVQPSIGVRLFMTQSSSAWGRAGGTSDHFHPSVRRHEERHKQKNGQFLRKRFCAISCTQFYFQCLREHLARYFTPKSIRSQEALDPNDCQTCIGKEI